MQVELRKMTEGNIESRTYRLYFGKKYVTVINRYDFGIICKFYPDKESISKWRSNYFEMTLSHRQARDLANDILTILMALKKVLYRK